MERTVIYRDRQELQSADLNNMQDFGRASMDHIVRDALEAGKAYSGFTDAELKKLDRHVRGNTVNRFGPVRETDKSLVFEVAFDSVHESKRHKSGLAMRFPRIHRIRWDKPPHEADRIEALRALVRD